MATTEQPAGYIGQPIVRKEDPELITGPFDAHAGRLRAFALNAVRDAATADDLV